LQVFNVAGAFLIMLNAGEGAISLGWRAGVSAAASPFMPSASSTLEPRSRSTIIKCPSIRVRIAIVSTLPSSKAKQRR
jgi:hypothetical protein